MSNNVLRSFLPSFLDRYLAQFIREIAAFPEEHLWHTPPGIANPAGVLAQHIVGNLNHFIGHALGGTDYVRHRDREFSERNATAAELIEALERTRAVVAAALAGVTDEALDTPLSVPMPPIPTGDVPLTAGGFLLELIHHTSYHLGQLNYLRRMQSEE